MRKISVKGVLIGGIVDIVSSGLLGIPLAVYALSKVDVTHTPKDQLAVAILAVTHASPWFYATQLLFGLLCSVLGGYVAASLAKHDELLNGTLSSVLCLAGGFCSIALGKDSHAHWVQFLLLVASPICGFLGGYLRVQQRRVRTLAV